MPTVSQALTCMAVHQYVGMLPITFDEVNACVEVLGDIERLHIIGRKNQMLNDVRALRVGEA